MYTHLIYYTGYLHNRVYINTIKYVEGFCVGGGGIALEIFWVQRGGDRSQIILFSLKQNFRDPGSPVLLASKTWLRLSILTRKAKKFALLSDKTHYVRLCRRWGSNPRPQAYESCALPTELPRQYKTL